MEENKKKGFSSSLGFILSAAGSAVGVGNIWRFPYLAAKDGRELFIFIYILLVLTFGFTLLTTDIAIGRKTKQNALHAFDKIHPKWNFLGKLTFLVPAIIMTFYSVIGGWILKYIVVYLCNQGAFAALTSSVSIMETLVANCMEVFHSSCKTTSLFITLISGISSIVICLGYNLLYFEILLPNGTIAQLLDIMDDLSNSLLMPLISLLTCILIGWVVKPKWIIDEVESSGHQFGRKNSILLWFVTYHHSLC